MRQIAVVDEDTGRQTAPFLLPFHESWSPRAVKLQGRTPLVAALRHGESDALPGDLCGAPELSNTGSVSDSATIATMLPIQMFAVIS